MTVLMNAGPWLSVPPPGYGGIENVIAALVPELRRRGVRGGLASGGDSSLPVDELVSVYGTGQFRHLQRPFNQVMGVAAAHLHRVVTELRNRDDVLLVHDHQEAFGLTVLNALGPDMPHVLHTLHWDLHKHPELYGNIDGGGRTWVNGVSFAQLATAPQALRAISVGHVHLATPLAVHADRRPAPRKEGHLVVLGRVTHYKGQHVAAALAHRLGRDLVLAGPVGPHHRPADQDGAADGQPAGRDGGGPVPATVPAGSRPPLHTRDDGGALPQALRPRSRRQRPHHPPACGRRRLSVVCHSRLSCWLGCGGAGGGAAPGPRSVVTPPDRPWRRNSGATRSRSMRRYSGST